MGTLKTYNTASNTCIGDLVRYVDIDGELSYSCSNLYKVSDPPIYLFTELDYEYYPDVKRFNITTFILHKSNINEYGMFIFDTGANEWRMQP